MLRRQWFCEDDAPRPLQHFDNLREAIQKIEHLIDEEDPLLCCPWQRLEGCQAVGVGLRAHKHYKSGFLWEPGSAGQQPSRLMSMIETIEDELGKIQKEENEERERERKKQEAKNKSMAKAGRFRRLFGW